MTIRSLARPGVRVLRTLRARALGALEKVHERAKPAYRPAFAAFGAWARARRRHATFIGITGSWGKTTTKDLVVAVLSARHRVTQTPADWNSLKAIVATIVRTTRRHRFAVLEIGATGPGSLDELLAVTQPHIGIVTTIGADHLSAFRTLDATALEKSKLIAALPPLGRAILNADDPLVSAMRDVSRAPVITFGLAETAMLRAVDVRSAWPELTFTVRYGRDEVPVQTRLCGAHWVTAALAALATGVACGIPLADAAAALAGVESWEGRMSAMVDADGVTFIRADPAGTPAADRVYYRVPGGRPWR